MAMAMPQEKYGCYVGNIDASVSLGMLKECFSQCGRILNASLNGRETDPYRYGFLDFGTEEERNAALRFNGFSLAGRQLKVGVSKGTVGNPNPAPAANQFMLHGPAGMAGLPPNMTGMPVAQVPQMMAPVPQAMAAYAPQAMQPMMYAPARAAFRAANEPPSAEIIKLREIQKAQFLAAVQRDAEKYQKKTGKKHERHHDESEGSENGSKDESQSGGSPEAESASGGDEPEEMETKQADVASSDGSRHHHKKHRHHRHRSHSKKKESKKEKEKSGEPDAEVMQGHSPQKDEQPTAS